MSKCLLLQQAYVVHSWRGEWDPWSLEIVLSCCGIFFFSPPPRPLLNTSSDLPLLWKYCAKHDASWSACSWHNIPSLFLSRFTISSCKETCLIPIWGCSNSVGVLRLSVCKCLTLADHLGDICFRPILNWECTRGYRKGKTGPKIGLIYPLMWGQLNSVVQTASAVRLVDG